jgi:hypothetical protein
MYLATCNMLYFAVFYVNELQTSGYYHQSPVMCVCVFFVMCVCVCVCGGGGCNVYVCVGFVMCGCFGNMYTVH